MCMGFAGVYTVGLLLHYNTVYYYGIPASQRQMYVFVDIWWDGGVCVC